MKPLVLTSFLIPEFIKSGLADLAVHFFHRFIGDRCRLRMNSRLISVPVLPWHRTGLGATEMRMLELIAGWKPTPLDIGRHEARDSGRVFGYWEQGVLLDGLARCRKPLVSGLKEGPFTMELHDDRERRRRYTKSKLALTPLGYSILAQTDSGANRRFCSPQPDSARVGRNETDEQESMALGLGQ